MVTASPDDYCSACHDFDPQGPLHERDAVLRDTFGIHRVALENRTPAELRRRRDDCYRCAVLLAAAYKLASDWDKMTIWLEDHQNPKISLTGKDACSFELYTTEADSPVKHLHPLLEVPASPRSEATMDFMARQVKDCHDNHDKCKINHEFMPKRLIRLTEKGGHIIHPDEPVPYIALSYCWGGDKNIRTLRANITAHMDSINLGHLPRCFRDVAVIAPRLGINHLWVDSLCIIQDDHADWEDQFPRMSWVYKNASVVIAAAAIGNCQESFLGDDEHDERMRRPESFVIRDAHPSQPAAVRARAVPTIGLHEDLQSFYSARDPLDCRGWPLQERLLATRILVYSRTELQWSCQTLQACEGGHTSSPNHPFTPLITIDTAEKAFSLWHSQVMEFSKRRLTFETDKLPAISAVAGHVADVTGSRYIAGLWRDNLIRDMCWERHMFESLKWEATRHWRAPSFSWASVAGNVFYNDNSIAAKGFYLSQVVDAGATRQSSPVFGQVVDAWVDMEAPLIEATLETHPPYDGSDLFDYNNPGAMFPHGHPETLFLAKVGGWQIPFRGDTHLAPGPIRPTPREPAHGLGNTAYRVRDVDSVELSPPVTVWVMIVGYWWEYTNKYPNGQRWLTSIVLGRSERQPGAYERLGYKNQPWPPWEKIPQEDFDRINTHVHNEGEKQHFRIV
ncbi:hypothetical protein QIS74_12039 [Colletotrichum tabaci]|uniref:Heterokaryon incompatibility domain-containing protein n=1 Tax=Colletotrichum tabaci TaxID=1209068 RepID=A0AAV9SW90_9PEZI